MGVGFRALPTYRDSIWLVSLVSQLPSRPYLDLGEKLGHHYLPTWACENFSERVGQLGSSCAPPTWTVACNLEAAVFFLEHFPGTAGTAHWDTRESRDMWGVEGVADLLSR